MERLTYNDDGCWQVHGADQNLCKQVCEEYSNCDSCPIGRAIDRLAEYEDTGLTVERAAELGKADSEGRVVVLPVGPEDTVYEIKRCSTKEAAAKGVHLDRKKVGRYSRDYIFPRNRPLKIVERKMVKSLYAKIGKTVFLTREEAEKVLEAEDHA